MANAETVNITGTRKTVVLGLVGAVIILSATAVAVPSSREYVVTVVKLLMEFTKTFAM